MSVFREIPPTAGLPIYLKDLLHLFNPKTHESSLEDDFMEYLNVDYAKVTYSGTAALYLILEALKEVSFKKTVIMPSYICPLVPLAVKRAGLVAQVCDINNDDFNFNLNKLRELCSRNNDILAIIPAHLAGIPVDFDSIEGMVRGYKIFTIEDCAQSLGATYKGKKVGRLGDFSFFSLCRGKGLTIYEGGAVVVNKKEYIPILDKKIRELVRDDFVSEGIKLLELFGYWVFYRPSLFWFVYKLPQLFWNLKGRELKVLMEDFTMDFPIHKVSGVRKLVGHVSFHHLTEEIKKQRQKADYYIRGLKDIKGIKVVKEMPGSWATYPYLTVLFDDLNRRNNALKFFKNLGLGISIVYARAINDYDYLKDIMPYSDSTNGRALAEKQLTLSTSAFLTQKEQNLILEIIRSC